MPDSRGDTQLRVFEGDIRDADFVRKACRGASLVFHVASVIDVKESLEHSEVHGVNVRGEGHMCAFKVWFCMSLPG